MESIYSIMALGSLPIRLGKILYKNIAYDSEKDMEKKLRPNIEVITRIAQAFNNNPSLKKTHLHLASRVRWNSFVRYFDWLKINGYIQCKIEGKTETYVLTNYGREMFDKLLKFAEESRSIAVIIKL